MFGRLRRQRMRARFCGSGDGVSRNNERMAQTTKPSPDSTGEERAAARERAKHLKAQEASAAALTSVLDKIASLDEPGKTNAERMHAIVTRVAPSMAPKLLYGSPAYANADGKPVLFYQERARLRITAISCVTVSCVATASSSAVESSARRFLPFKTPVSATTVFTASKTRCGCGLAARR